MQHLDIIIIGAGISGIDAACHFSMHCPKKTYTIFEGRDNIGGTWDLFKYPGIRSDSDMHTFSYSFKPWTYNKTISDADTILQYLEETVTEYKIKDKIRFNHYMTEIAWSSKENKWTVTGTNKKTNQVVKATCSFLMLCTGYYDYENGYTPEFKGLENFKGRFVHPQKWTDDIDYENKEVVVIGSGATAVTLVPTMAEKTKHITMLQRSPTYILSRPLHDGFAKWMHRLLPNKMAHFFARWKNILLGMYVYWISRRKPDAVKKFVKGQIKKVLGKDYDVETHFNPKYNPWDERLCVVPDSDLLHAIKDGKCAVVTDHIDTFTSDGILLKSGKELKADLIVSATGLVIKMAGGMKIEVDGVVQDISKLVNYKGLMLQDIPNLGVIVGYTNASWTLKADLVCAYICRLLNYMDEKGFQQCVPKLDNENIEVQPVIDFSSGYIQRALDKMPKQGDKFPWKLHQNYIKDMVNLRYGKIDDGYLEFG